MIANRFETILADTVESREIHYNIRYQVFCEETGFEDPSRFPEQQEFDEFDRHSTHFIVWDRLERQWVGAMRLVGGTTAPMPCETICAEPLEGIESVRIRSREFSRLCIVSKYRQTPSSFRFGLAAPNGEPDGQQIPTFFRQEDHEIFLRLLRASFDWGKKNSVDNCFFIINAALARVLKRFGIPLTVVGAAVEHRGARIPHRYDVHEAEAGMTATLPNFARIIRNSCAYVPYSEFIRTRTKIENPASAELPRWETPANPCSVGLH